MPRPGGPPADNRAVLQLFHAVSAGQPLRPRPATDLAEVVGEPGWWWFDAVEPELDDVTRLGALLDIHPFDLDDVAQPTELPKLDERDDYLFVVAHTPSLDPDRLRTVEVDAFLGDGYLVTIRREASPGFDELAEMVVAEAVPGPDVLLSMLLDVFARRTVPLIDVLDDEIYALEDLAIVGNPAVPERVLALRRDAIRLRRVIMPQRDMVGALGGAEERFVHAASRRRLASAHDDYVRVADSLDVARALLSSVLETYRSTVAERMNEVMKVLTVFSAIVLPLGLMAGIYGMNFANIPELDWRYGYFALLGVMATVGIGLWLYFARRGFIGGPKLPRVDRVVSRGLAGFVHLTIAPVRAARDVLTNSLGERRPPEGDGDAPA